MKLFKQLMICGMSLFLGLLTGATLSYGQTTENVDIYLHKLVFPQGEVPAASQNDGTTNWPENNLLTDYQGLNGVTFEAFDVSADYYLLLEAGMSAQQAQEDLVQNASLTQSKGTVVTAASNGEDGIALFQLPCKTQEGKDAVYLFHEVATPAGIKEISANLVVVLPIVDQAAQALATIHLYPKNETNLHITPTLTKKINTKAKSYSYGEIVAFTIETQIPTDISAYQLYQLIDKADTGLHFQPDSFQLSIDEVSISDLYHFSSDDHGFKVLFPKPDALAVYSGKTIKLTYEMVLDSLDDLDHTLINQATLETSFEQLEKKVFVKTGGAQFKKVDLSDEMKPLAGAEFIIQNQQGETLTKSASSYHWAANSEDTERVILQSATDGQFAIKGLAEGTYKLIEMKAPNGYVKSQTAIPFTVTATSYGSNEKNPLKIVNKQKQTGSCATTSPAKTGQLPKTGMRNQTILILAGILLIGISLWGKWKSNKDRGGN